MDKIQNESAPQTAELQFVENKLPQPGLKPERSANIDVMRGIAMIFVIAAHMPLTQQHFGYGVLMVLFYVVPLYFIVSGYLLAASAAKNSFPRYLWSRVKGLLFPYIFFFLFSYLWTNTVQAFSWQQPLFNDTLPWLEFLKTFAFAGEFLFDSAVITPPLWFLHALFLTSIAFYFIAKIKNKYIVTAIALALLILSIPVKQALGETSYWILVMFPAVLFFMTFGYLCRLYMNWFTALKNRVGEKYKNKNYPPVFNSFLAVILLIATFFLMQLGRGDIWAYTSEWYFLAALVFSLAIFLLSRETKNRVLIYMGRNSLYFLALHGPVLQISPIADLPAVLINRGFDETAAYFCYFLIALLAVIVLVFAVVFIKDMLKRLFKYIASSRREKKKAEKVLINPIT